MDLYTLGEKKVALYAVIPDNDNTFVRPDNAVHMAKGRSQCVLKS